MVGFTRRMHSPVDPSIKPPVKPNVIILTSGITGSSVLTGLIAQAGFWTGDTTFKKEEYDTYENSGLIRLNLQILGETSYRGNYTRHFSQEAIDLVNSLHGKLDEAPYRQFLNQCASHRPWVWKDPRLWLTIRFWAKLLPLRDCRFVLLTRDLKRAWVSSLLRRHVRSFTSLKRYELGIKDSLVAFLEAEELPCLQLTYEQLITTPEQAIAQLNAHIGASLTVEDLKRVFRGPLYKAPRSSTVDYAKAIMIYLKNYSERMDIEEQQSGV